MLYLYADKNLVKLLFIKKTLLGQYETAFFEKDHQIELTKNGTIVNTDFFASAIREAITLVNSSAIKDKDITLILPQEAFSFLRVEVPVDIANSAISSFIRDKARANLEIDLDNSFFDYLIHENEGGRHILFFSISKDALKKYNEALALLNLQLTSVVPETLAYFKLFEKTLRKDKREYIMYATYEKEEIKAYMYDTYGPLEDKKLIHDSTKVTSIEKVLQQKAEEYEKAGKKINRLILSGQDSETIRQDTFTKEVGIWTNPLKKIIPEFYQDYLKILVSSPNKQLPFLTYDVCIGAFIFSLENRDFSFFKKNGLKKFTSTRASAPSERKPFPLKSLGMFVALFALSFAVAFGVLWLFMHNSSTNKTTSPNELIAKVTPTSAPAVSPTPALDKKTVKLKVLNGTGTAGEASKVKQILKDAGYDEVLTGNADNYDYTTTEIQVKKSMPGLAETLKNDLKDHTANPKITTLDESSTADAIVIFGTDFK